MFSSDRHCASRIDRIAQINSESFALKASEPGVKADKAHSAFSARSSSERLIDKEITARQLCHSERSISGSGLPFFSASSRSRSSFAVTKHELQTIRPMRARSISEAIMNERIGVK